MVYLGGVPHNTTEKSAPKEAGPYRMAAELPTERKTGVVRWTTAQWRGLGFTIAPEPLPLAFSCRVRNTNQFPCCKCYLSESCG